MKNFEESLRQLSAPDLQVTAFRHKLRHDLSVARVDLNLRRWRSACIASAAVALLLAGALIGTVVGSNAAPSGSLEGWLAANEITIQDDREFLEAYHARQASDVQIRSVDEERLVAIREFTMSDGRQMVVYTEVDGGRSSRSAVPLNDRLAELAMQTSQSTMF